MDPRKSTPHKPSLSMSLSQSVENETDLEDDTEATLDIDERHQIGDGNDINVTNTVLSNCRYIFCHVNIIRFVLQ